MTGHHTHWHRGTGGRLVSQRPQVIVGLDSHDLSDSAGIVAEVHPIASADLDHPASQSGQQPVSVPGGSAPFRFGADTFIHPRKSRVLKLCQVRHIHSPTIYVPT